MIDAFGIMIENDHVLKLLMAATEVNNDGHIEFVDYVSINCFCSVILVYLVIVTMRIVYYCLCSTTIAA